MKKRILAAVIVAALSCAAYPQLEQFAEIERGCSDPVFGGEEILLLFGLFMAVYILFGGLSKHKKKNGSQTTTVSQTESEQSESNSL